MKYFQRMSDWASTAFGSPWFLIIHLVFWSFWMAFAAFDPYPFNLLTLTVSLESILLSGLLLNATNRSGDEDRRIISKDLKLDQATHNHVETILRKIQEVHDAVQATDKRPESRRSSKRSGTRRLESE
jgi:uncharacterized membrane protein